MPKNKSYKKYIKFLMYGIAAFVIAAMFLPFLFKDKLVAMLKENINHNINAVVDFKDADLSFLRSFPDVQINIDSLSVVGLDDFEDIVLYQAKETKFDVSLSSLIGENKIPKINSIDLVDPIINVVILDSIRANYLITVDTSTTAEPSAFKLQLAKYSIKGGQFMYIDRTMNLVTSLSGIEMTGSGDFTQDIFDLSTSTVVDKMNVDFDGIKYFTDVKTTLKAKINMDLPQSKFTLEENIIRLNELDLTGDGFIQLAGDDINMDINFGTASQDFKSFLSIIPNAYTSDFRDVKTKGKANITGFVKGTYNGLKNQMPGFEVNIGLDNGYVKYPSVPNTISDVFAQIKIKATRSDYKDMSLNIPNFMMKFGEDQMSGRINASNLTGDQNLDGALVAKLNLGNLTKSFPIQDIENLSGLLDCDMSFRAKMSDVNNENYDAITFQGGALAKNIVYKAKDKPLVTVKQAELSASPKYLSFKGYDMVLGKGDLNLSASVENPLAIFSTDKNILVNINGQSNYFDLNEWMESSDVKSPPVNTVESSVPPLIDENLIMGAKMNINFKAGKVDLNEYHLNNIVMDGKISANAIQINEMSGIIDDNDFKISGMVVNAYDYLFSDGMLDGKINFKSQNFNTNPYMQVDTVTANPGVIAVPDRVRMVMEADIKNLVYTNLELKNFHSTLEVKNNEVALRNTQTQALGGLISMDGLYNTSNIEKPDFSIKLDLSKIKFSEAIDKFTTFQKLVPVAEYIDGIFNTTIVMNGELGKEMTPDLSTLNASGFLETLSGNLKGFKVLNDLSEKLGVKEIKEVNLANTKNWFDVVKGFVELKDFNKVVGGVDMTISGKHGFATDMDYVLNLIIPRELMDKNKIGAQVNKGLSLLEGEASKLGLNINQGPNLFVDVKITGSIKNPSFKIIPKTSTGSSASEAVKNKIDESITTLKDTINKEIKKKQEEIKDTVTKRVNQEIDKAKTKVEEVANEAIENVKEQAKTQVNKAIDSLAKGAAMDSLKQKAKDILNNQSKDDVDKIKDKLNDFNPFKKKKQGG